VTFTGGMLRGGGAGTRGQTQLPSGPSGPSGQAGRERGARGISAGPGNGLFLETWRVCASTQLPPKLQQPQRILGDYYPCWLRAQPESEAQRSVQSFSSLRRFFRGSEGQMCAAASGGLSLGKHGMGAVPSVFDVEYRGCQVALASSRTVFHRARHCRPVSAASLTVV
jgi:hypothetical protein